MSKMEEAVNAIQRMCTVVDAFTEFEFEPGARPEYAALHRLKANRLVSGARPDRPLG
jgi:hypothetical protein